ncbi:hypothetical protein QWZ08_00320 [Ferruginibacter paludis]|uniref:hypothetical protein n=1 Tax=Ferruginibacter paludis TaxID=1310417 RepID=UPI0025B38031|nr:hypothetical protein [Ferruginibacter paludis]MDN3654045.1 hypothetical protein [Ferruginibacter paludis]
MVVHLLPIPSLALEKVRYYTVLLENKGISEFRDFIQRAAQHSPVELAEINRYIQQIGEKYGASENHFKPEDAAERLPPPYHEFIETEDVNDFGLRLYCIRLTTGIVILLNGDRKTALKVKDCEKCYRHFDLARKIARKINAAILDGYIEINDSAREIEVEQDFELIV